MLDRIKNLVKGKFKWTVVGVVTFIIVLLAASYDARAENGARISLGHTVANSEVTVGEVSYEWNDWEAGAMLIGEGDTKNGEQSTVPVYSVSHLVCPEWSILGADNYYRLGVAYVDGSPLVGDWNFRLGVGLEWKVFQLEYAHLSSAGIYETNSGIDMIQLRYKIPAVW